MGPEATSPDAPLQPEAVADPTLYRMRIIFDSGHVEELTVTDCTIERRITGELSSLSYGCPEGQRRSPYVNLARVVCLTTEAL